MRMARLPSDEPDRLAALDDYEILDTPTEAAYDDITQITAQICGTPIALVSLVDENRQWFKSRVGIEATETPRDIAFCAHAILEPGRLFVVCDTALDERFTDNPLVTEDPKIRFYAGAPLVSSSGYALGTLCAIDHAPRSLDERQAEALKALARQVEAQLELRLSIRREQAIRAQLERSSARLAEKIDELQSCYHTVPHELKTPLSAAREFVSLVLDGVGGELTTTQHRHLRKALDCCDRLTFILNNWMETVRSETGKLELHLESTDVGQVAGKMVETYAVTAAKRNITLELEAPAMSAVVDIDVLRVEQTLANLISNAVKFTDPGGWVRVRTGTERDRIFIEISDNGRGIRSSHQKDIFSPFFQAERSDTSEQQGMGLGLHVCRSIVEKHGGELTLKSVFGAGSTFTVWLPMESPAIQEALQR